MISKPRQARRHRRCTLYGEELLQACRVGPARVCVKHVDSARRKPSKLYSKQRQQRIDLVPFSRNACNVHRKHTTEESHVCRKVLAAVWLMNMGARSCVKVTSAVSHFSLGRNWQLISSICGGKCLCLAAITCCNQQHMWKGLATACSLRGKWWRPSTELTISVLYAQGMWRGQTFQRVHLHDVCRMRDWWKACIGHACHHDQYSHGLNL